METCRVAFLGLGTVGAAAVELLARYAPGRGDGAATDGGTPGSGHGLVLTAAAVRDVQRPRSLPPGMRLTDDADALCVDPDIDVIVELVGGTEAPRRWIGEALASGKHVVTANKAVLAAHGEELFALAHRHGRALLFEGAVAGAIPILQVIRQGFTAGPVEAITAILNGSCNWLLGELEVGRSFSSALEEARQRGLVEADPTLDLSGQDSIHKLALIARLVEARAVSLEAIRCEGITRVRPEDLAFGRRHEQVLKLIGVFRRREKGAALGVYPAWLPASHPLSSVRDENNAVLLEGPTFHELLFQGRGAGGMPTAGSVVADIQRLRGGHGFISDADGALRVSDPLAHPCRHYLRFEVTDEPGVLAAIARTLAHHDVSIASVEQPEAERGARAWIQMITHRTPDAVIQRALRELEEGPPTLHAPPLRIPFEAGGDGRTTP